MINCYYKINDNFNTNFFKTLQLSQRYQDVSASSFPNRSQLYRAIQKILESLPLHADNTLSFLVATGGKFRFVREEERVQTSTFGI